MSIVLVGSTSGSVTLQEPAVAGTTILTLPSTSGTILQSGTAVTEAQGGTGTTTGYYGFKNRLINSAMVIDQRNAGASATTFNTYSLDRWYINNNSGATRFSWQQNAGSVTPPAGFTNYLGITSSGAYSVTATNVIAIAHRIEGFNVADLNWGSANAKTVTLSFWVRSSLTGTFGGALLNSAQNRSYPFSYTINSANTWEYETITIAGDTSGTWLTNNGIGLDIYWSLGTGSTYSGTAGSWSGSQLFSATGATSVVGTNGATFYITGVQLEVGSTATSFDYRPYGTELALCQRYYQTWGSGVLFPARANSTTSVTFSPSLTVPLRASPTITNGTMRAFSGSAIVDSTATATVSVFTANANAIALNVGSFSSVSDDRIYNLGNQTAALTLSSEL